MTDDPAETLLTVRDHLRHAVGRFRAARIEHGHGARSALDEAAFMILETLSLPVDDINPWLDARLLPSERRRLIELVEARIATRKPFAYLLGKTYLAGVPFHVDERVIVPRSYIAELLNGDAIHGGPASLVEDAGAVRRALDLCTGSGCLAVLAAMSFPNAAIDAVDLSAEALEVARINRAMHGFEDRIALHEGDLFGPLKNARYDVILTNPPYVPERLVAAFPPEHAAEPRMAHAGGEDGLDVVRRILATAPDHLEPGGVLICEVGEAQEALEAAFDLPFLWLDTEESEGEVFALRREDFPAKAVARRRPPR
jgi:ribosomal protein L3 glutamine methyltransferase